MVLIFYASEVLGSFSWYKSIFLHTFYIKFVFLFFLVGHLPFSIALTPIANNKGNVALVVYHWFLPCSIAVFAGNKRWFFLIPRCVGGIASFRIIIVVHLFILQLPPSPTPQLAG